MHLQAHICKYVITLVYMFICTCKCVCSMHLYILYLFCLTSYIYAFWRQRSCHSVFMCMCGEKHLPLSNARCRWSPEQSPWTSPSCILSVLSIGGQLQNSISKGPELDATFRNTEEFHFYSLCSTSLPFKLLERGYKMKLLWHDRALHSFL